MKRLLVGLGLLAWACAARADVETNAAPSVTYGVTAYRASTQTLTNATLTYMLFDADGNDRYGMHDLTSCSAQTPDSCSKLTAPVAGWYNGSCSILFAAQATAAGVRSVYMTVNAASTAAMSIPMTASYNNATVPVAVSRNVYLNKGDFITCLVLQSSGGNLNTTAATDGNDADASASLVFIEP